MTWRKNIPNNLWPEHHLCLNCPCVLWPWSHFSASTSELNWTLLSWVSPFSRSFLLLKMKNMTRGQPGLIRSHISWGSACGLHSQKHTRTDSGRILPWPYTPAGLPQGQQRPCCNICIDQHLDHWTQPRGGGGVYLCALARMNQPLSAEPRPLTYWACSSKTWRSTLTLFPIFQ